MAFTPKNVTVAEPQQNINKSYKKILCQVNKFIYTDKYSGFFVIQVSLLEGEKTPEVIIEKKIFNKRIFSAVGISTLMSQSIQVGQEIELLGDFEIGKFDIQFSVNSILESVPQKPSAIKSFLAARIKGIGPKAAQEIVETYGIKSLQVLEDNPRLLLKFSGITEKKLKTINDSWQEWRAIHNIIIEMKSFDVGDELSLKIYRHFGSRSLDIIKNDPYSLTEVDSVGFKTADKIALLAGVDKNSAKRIQKGITQVLKEAADNGDTAVEKEVLIRKSLSLLGVNASLVTKTIDEMIIGKSIIQHDIKIKKWINREKNEYTDVIKTVVAHMKVFSTEFRIVKEINRIIKNNQYWASEKNKKNIDCFISENKFGLDPSQLAAASIVLSNKFSILTGGPGTGKTHTIKSLIDFYVSYNKESSIGGIKSLNYSRLNVVLCAPTGRASQRMEESTGKESSTIHSLLGLKDGVFTYGEQKQLSGDVFIVDEFSMVDTWLMNSLLKAIPNNAKIILVGDADQLESVGAGRVFGDLIDSKKIQVAKLEHIHRQAMGSNIIRAAYDIIHRKMPQLYDIESDSDFVFVEKETIEDVQQEILSIVADLVTCGVEHDNIQILSPKKDGEIGIFKLNHELRPILNPNFLKYDVNDGHFLPGDRIMQFKNNKSLNIFNGDVGKVISYEDQEMVGVIDFSGKRITLEKQEMNDINYSFATTIHKSQGSDYKIVIIPVSKSHSFMWNTNLLYTATTRGKDRVILVGDKKTLEHAVNNYKKTERLTNLRTILESYMDSSIEHNRENNTGGGDNILAIARKNKP